MAKTLNLDGFIKTERTLTLKGKTYNVIEMTVANFIETTQAAEKLKGETDLSKQVAASVEMIGRFVPECAAEVLRGLTVEQLGAVIAFVQGDLDVDAAGAPVVKAEGEPTGAGK